MPARKKLTELDRLDPAPAAPAAPAAPRPPARRKGQREAALARDLKAMPAALRSGALAVTALGLARDLDEGGMTDRDKTGVARELRMYVADLTAMAPGERKGDSTDEVRARREARLAAAPGQSA